MYALVELADTALRLLARGLGDTYLPMRLGHFAASRWLTRDGTALSEIFIGGEGLERGAGPVLATVLHEGAHLLAYVREIQDTSRQGRYRRGGPPRS